MQNMTRKRKRRNVSRSEVTVEEVNLKMPNSFDNISLFFARLKNGGDAAIGSQNQKAESKGRRQ